MDISYLPEKPIIENEHFIIYGNNNLEPIKEEILNVLTQKKEELLSFFAFDKFPKVRINLFNNHDDYMNYHKSIGAELSAYSKGTFNKNTINKLYELEDIPTRRYWLINGLVHEYIHLLYQSIWQNNYERVVWLDEGLSQYLSGQLILLQRDDKKFKSWYLDEIVRRDKEIPNINFLKKHGNKYGEFIDEQSLKYDGYSISYLLVRYLMEIVKIDIPTLLKNKKQIDLIENNIISECINFYNSYFKVYDIKNNFYDINTPEELLDYMTKNILYGWLDKNNNKYLYSLKDFRTNYRISSIDEILTAKLATCIEDAKLIKYFFDIKEIESKIFCYRSYENEDNFDKEVKMHCFVLYNLNGNWYHFEHSNYYKRGIYQYDNIDIALNEITKSLDDNDIKELSEINDIPDGLSFKEFNQFVNQFNKKRR